MVAGGRNCGHGGSCGMLLFHRTVERNEVKLTECQAKCLTESAFNKFASSHLQAFSLLLNIDCNGTSSP